MRPPYTPDTHDFLVQEIQIHEPDNNTPHYVVTTYILSTTRALIDKELEKRTCALADEHPTLVDVIHQYATIRDMLTIFRETDAPDTTDTPGAHMKEEIW